MNIRQLQSEEIQILCIGNKVKSLFAFGSVIRDDFNETDPFKYSELYFNLKDNLEKLLQRQVDLIEARAIKNPVFKEELEKTKIKIYEL
ncbi:MAG: nucleotidyltransferase [Nitrosopumilus sp.]|nr:nucleotidyltransferase [Nitrosopumilus sp.]